MNWSGFYYQWRFLRNIVNLSNYFHEGEAFRILFNSDCVLTLTQAHSQVKKNRTICYLETEGYVYSIYLIHINECQSRTVGALLENVIIIKVISRNNRLFEERT